MKTLLILLTAFALSNAGDTLSTNNDTLIYRVFYGGGAVIVEYTIGKDVFQRTSYWSDYQNKWDVTVKKSVEIPAHTVPQSIEWKEAK